MQAYTTPPPPTPQTSRSLILQSLCARMQARQLAKLAHLDAARQTWQHDLLTLRRLQTRPPPPPAPTPALPVTPPPQPSQQTVERYWHRMAAHGVLPSLAPAPEHLVERTAPVALPIEPDARADAEARGMSPVNSVQASANGLHRNDVAQQKETVHAVSAVQRPNLVLYLRRVLGRWITAIQREERRAPEAPKVATDPASAATLGAAAQALIVILSAGMGAQ